MDGRDGECRVALPAAAFARASSGESSTDRCVGLPTKKCDVGDG
jgi:hypothetical protein